MNAKKILAMLVLAFTMVALLASCAKKHEHEFGDWTITTSPTEQDPGVATRECECDETEEVTIPALTNTEVWTKKVTPATHAAAGLVTYTSEYGTVEVALAIVPHDWTYTLTTAPTETAAGEANKSCECGVTEKVTVPALSDTSVWSSKVTASPSHVSEGEKVYTSELYGEVKVTLPKNDQHSYGDWTITQEPTETATGTAIHECACGVKESATVPALSDTAVWTSEVTLSPSHVSEGEKTYSSEYGEVKVTLPKNDQHSYGAWTITKEPTETATGTAIHECACGVKENATVPALSDTSVWTAKVTTPATYNEAGEKTYSSEYGEVKTSVAKLVAPYDGKTYTNLVFEGELDNTNKKINAQDTWSNATLTLDENGYGFCTSYPYRGFTQITMVDPETGKIDITIYDLITTDADGNTLDTPIPNYESYITYPAYVDFDTGIIVRARNSAFDYVVLYTPFEADPSSDSAIASSWNGNAMAITYTVNDTAYSVFCASDRAYLDVTFSDMAGNAVSADTCFNAPYVYIKNAEGGVIASYGYDGEKQNALDGIEGTYTNTDNGDLFLSGYGTLTMNGVSGSYTVAAEDASHDIEVSLKDADGNVTHFYLVTIGDDNTYTFTKPEVTITFVTGDYATQEPLTYNKLVPQTLPTYTHSTMTFKGWYYDAACTQPVESPFVPTESVTLYANWKSKVVITLVGVAAGDDDKIYLGEGDVIGDFLPEYGLDTDNYKKFVAWYVDVNGNGELDADDMALDLETTISAEDTGATIIAKWDNIPAYYGTYYGTELYNAGYGNNGNKTLVIDENGNMSGLETGIIVSYDPATQVVKWKDNAEDTVTKTFYFDAETGIIAGIYNDNNIGNDFHFLSRYESEDGKVDAFFGVKAPKTPGSSEYGWYAHFITADTKLGEDTTIFLYNNYIYNNVTITSATGEALTPATVKDSKTVVVKDNDTGNIIVSVTSLGESFSNNSNTTVLDAYFGSYAMGDETVALDGTGIITYAGKTGTYTAIEGGFEVYFAEGGVNTEYYFMTLDTAAKTCQLTKPMVNLTLDVDGKNAAFTQIGSTNANIAVALPTLTAEGFVFRGWYVQGDASTTVVGDSYTPTKDVTLVALWKVKNTLTIVYNDTVTDNLVIEYGEGETATVENPTYAKHKFDGWFTTATFDAGTEWVSGTAINGNVIIYAKWSDAPVYNLTYTVTELERNNDSNITDIIKAYTRTAAVFTIDPDGKSPKTSYPFATGEISITDYDPETGSLVFNCGTKSYKGYVDSETGIILLNYATGDADMEEFFLLNPFATNSIASNISASYWNGGKTACIVYAFDAETSYTIFVNNNVVYFGVSFEDADGNAVAGKECYQASSMLYVKDADGNTIAYFAYNGTTMCELDGYEGTYTGANGDVVVSGYGTLTIAGLNGTYTKLDDDTFAVYTFNADNTVNMYYEVDIDKVNKTYNAAPVPVTITFESANGAADPQSAFANVPTTLPTLTAEGFVFRGWYVQGDENQTIVDADAFVTAESVTLVAKWDDKFSMTIVYGNTLETVIDYYGEGDTPVLVEPAYTNGKAFDGWFTDAECTVGYVNGPITENTTVYAKWIDAHPMYGSYTGSNVYGGSATGGTNSGGSSNVNIIIDALGIVTGKTPGQIKEYDPETGIFKLYPDDSKYYLGVYDAETGVLIYNYSTGKTEMINDVYIFAPGNTFKCSSTEGCYWNSGKTKLGAIQCDAGVVNYFMFNNRIYTGVTWTSTDGEVEAKSAYLASNLSVYDRDGNLIAYFAKEDGKGLVHKVSDGMAGSYYTDAQNNALALNGYGAGKITNAAQGLDEAALTYTVMGDDAAYDLLVVIGDAYYEVTISGANYTIKHIQYTIKFVTGIDGYTIDDVKVEYNADYNLPSGIDQVGYKFEGWYTTADFSGSRVYWYEENADMIYYAKWSSICTVTLVYGNGIENVNLSYSSGTEITMGASLSPDGAGLYIWYKDEACTELFDSATVEGNMSLYGVRVADVTYGSYKFVEKDGKFVTNNQGADSSTASMTITMLGNYSVTYNYTTSTESGYDKFSVKETISDTTTTTVSGASGDDSGSKTAALAAGDSINFAYTKDGSSKSGDDTVTLTFTITPNA